MVKESIFKTGDMCGQFYRIVRMVSRNAWIEKYLAKREDTHHTAILTCSRFGHIVGDAPSPALFASIADRIRSSPLTEMPKIYDFGVQGAVYWIASQYIDAPDVMNLNKERRDASPEWRVLDALSLASSAAYILGDALNCGLLHGHLTPEHIAIDGMPFDMNIFVRDIGYAELFQFNEIAAINHARYCAPELIKGGAPDTRADIYSIGMILYHLIANQPPYGDKITGEHDPALISMVLEKLPTDLNQLSFCPAPLWDLIRRAIQKDPEKRFQTLDEFYEMVEHITEKIENDPRIQRHGEELRAKAEANKTALVPLIVHKRGTGEPKTVPHGPNTAMRRRAAWVGALANAVPVRVAPENAVMEEQARAPSDVESPRRADAKDEAIEALGPATERSPAAAPQHAENAPPIQEAPRAPAPPQKPAFVSSRTWKAWGRPAIAGMSAALLLVAGYMLAPRGGQAPHETDIPRAHLSIEVVAGEPAKEAESMKPPACAPSACMMVAATPCTMCEPRKAEIVEPQQPRKEAPKHRGLKSAKEPEPCRGGLMFCFVPQDAH